MPSEQLEALTALIAASRPTTDTPLEDQRSGLDLLAGSVTPPEGTTVDEIDAGGVRCLLAAPPDAGERLVVHLHGGGFCIGSGDASVGFAARLASRLGARALVVDYRRAPEHPFPAPHDDALAAWRHALEHLADPGDTVLTGDSAGGGLALATLVRARDLGLAPPAAGVLISPWLDLRPVPDELRARAGREVMLDPDLLGWWAGALLDGHRADDPVASPVLAQLSDLPPLLVQVGADEMLVDDSLALAAAAARARLDVTLEVSADAFHIWAVLPGAAPEADGAFDRMTAYLARQLDP